MIPGLITNSSIGNLKPGFVRGLFRYSGDKMSLIPGVLTLNNQLWFLCKNYLRIRIPGHCYYKRKSHEVFRHKKSPLITSKGGDF
jgi:hypothetical protein